MGDAVFLAEQVLKDGFLTTLLESVGIVVLECVSQFLHCICRCDDRVVALGIEHGACGKSVGGTLVKATIGLSRKRKVFSSELEVLLDEVPSLFFCSERCVLTNIVQILIDNDFFIALYKFEIQECTHKLDFGLETRLVSVGHLAVFGEVGQ